MADFVTDTFTDTEATLLVNHTGETGATWAAITSESITLSHIFSNALGWETLGGEFQNAGSASGTPASADYEVFGELRVNGGGTAATNWVGFAARVQAGVRTYYLGVWNSADGRYEIGKYVSGTFTSIATQTASEPADGNILKFRVSGTTLKMLLNDVEKLSTTDSSISAAGKAGFFYYDTGGTTTLRYGLRDLHAGPIAAGGGFKPGIKSPFIRTGDD